MGELSIYEVIVIYLPGLLVARIDMYYGSERTPAIQNQLYNIIFFGSLAHILAALMYQIANIVSAMILPKNWDISLQYDVWFFSLAEWNNPQEIVLNECLDEIAVSTLISTLIVAGWLKISRKQYVQRLLQQLNLTNHFSEKDLWSHIQGQKLEENEFVNLRDRVNDIIYSGWIEMYHEYGNIREFLLYDVTIYEMSTMNKLYKEVIPSMYISRPSADMVLEFPRRILENQNDHKENKTLHPKG